MIQKPVLHLLLEGASGQYWSCGIACLREATPIVWKTCSGWWDKRDGPVSSEREGVCLQAQPLPDRQTAYPSQRFQMVMKVVRRLPSIAPIPNIPRFMRSLVCTFWLPTRAGSIEPSARFLKRAVKWHGYRGIQVKWVQADNSSEFTSCFQTDEQDHLSLLEEAIANLDIYHRLIRPDTPSLNGKVVHSHKKKRSIFSRHSFLSMTL